MMEMARACNCRLVLVGHVAHCSAWKNRNTLTCPHISLSPILSRFCLPRGHLLFQGAVQRSLCVLLDGAAAIAPGGPGPEPEASLVPAEHPRDHPDRTQPGRVHGALRGCCGEEGGRS